MVTIIHLTLFTYLLSTQVETGNKAELILVNQQKRPSKFNSLKTGDSFHSIRWGDTERRKWRGRIYIGFNKRILEHM